MQDTNLPSLFCGTAQDSKDSSNSRKKRRSNNKKGSRTKPCSSTNIATCKANNDHGAALQVLVNCKLQRSALCLTELFLISADSYILVRKEIFKSLEEILGN